MTHSVSGQSSNTQQLSKAPALPNSSEGVKNGQKVTEAELPPQLNQLNPPHTKDASLDQRSASIQEEVKPTTGLQDIHSSDQESQSYTDLKKIEENTLEEAGKLLQKKEELRVTDLALAALEGQTIDKRYKLKITIQLPNDPPPPIVLFPLTETVKGQPKFDELIKMAAQALNTYKTDNYSDFNLDTFNTKISSLKDSLKSNAAKMAAKDPRNISDWENKYVGLECRQAHVFASADYDIQIPERPEPGKSKQQVQVAVTADNIEAEEDV